MKSFPLVVVCLTLVSVSFSQSNGAAPATHRVSSDAVAVQVDWDALPQNPDPAPPQSANTPPKQAQEEDKTSKILFALVPNNKSVEPGEHPGPMSPSEKFKLTRDYFSPFTLVLVALDAGFDQAIDAKPGYGQGWDGYGKRYGADFANGLTHTLFVTGVFPSLLHQDSRYYRKGEGSFGSRAVYSATRVLITRQDSGASAFNYSEILGSATSAGIADAYYPEVDRTVSGFFIRAGWQIAVESGLNLLREFRPDITKKVFKRE